LTAQPGAQALQTAADISHHAVETDQLGQQVEGNACQQPQSPYHGTGYRTCRRARGSDEYVGEPQGQSNDVRRVVHQPNHKIVDGSHDPGEKAGQCPPYNPWQAGYDRAEQKILSLVAHGFRSKQANLVGRGWI